MSMRCRESRRWISIKVDGERVPFSVAGRLEEHLGTCSPCRELLSTESRRAVILESVLHAADAEPLKASIWRGLAEEGGGGPLVPLPFPRSRFPLQVAAILLVAVGVWFALRWLALEAGGPGAGGPGVSDAAGMGRIILERDEWTGDVLSGSDGSPVGRGTHRVRRVIMERGPAGTVGDGGMAEPVRVDKARTDYIRLVDYPYW